MISTRRSAKTDREFTVVGRSRCDADTTLANWAREADFPIVFASDSGSKIGKTYGAFDPKNNVDNRSLLVGGAGRPDLRTS